MQNSPTTDEMDRITPEERNALVAYCDSCEDWWKFTRVEGVPILCPQCGGKYSNQIGFQLMTQRTFVPSIHGKKKAKKR